MTPERWEKLKDIFDIAAGSDSVHRAEIITERCEGDAELAAAAHRLIANHQANSGLFSPVAFLSTGEIPHQGVRDGATIAGRYRVVRLVGRGGMGEVYEAEDTLVGERVALKSILGSGAEAPDAAARFTSELRVARRVSHPNVCRVHDIVTEPAGSGERVFYTMELLHGETLADRLRREGPLPVEVASEIAGQLAAGLEAIHKAGIVHRDFKASNVFLEQAGDSIRAVITDFGLARVAASHGEAVTALMGTPDYMAPEVLEGAAPSTAADIYAFGIVLYEMVTGQLPFQNSSPFISALQRLRQPAPSPRALAPALNTRWESAILRCLERQPQLRFSSAREAVAVLRGDKTIAPAWLRSRLLGIGVVIALSALVVAAPFLNRLRFYRPASEAASWFDKATQARNSGDYFTAAKQLERAVAIEDRFAVAHALLADCYAAQDFGERAREEMIRANARAGEASIAQNDRLRIQAIELMLLREYPEAASRYELLARRVPAAERPAIQMDLGRSLESAEKTQAAIEAYKEVARANPADAASRVRLGVLLSRSGEKAEADTHFVRALELYESDGNLAGMAEAALHQSRAQILDNQIESGEKLLRRAMDVASAAQSPWLKIRVLLQLGIAARRKGDAPAARQYAAEGIELAREHDMDYATTAAMLDLGNTFLQLRDYDDAEKWFQTALPVARNRKDQRNEARALASLASLRLAQHRPAEADAFIRPALGYYTRGNYRRETAAVLLLAALAREQNGDVNGAEAVLRKNLELTRTTAASPDQIREAYSRLATLQVRREDYASALENYKAAERYASGKPPDGVSLINSALALWRLGRTAEAIAARQAAAAASESQKNIRARVRWLTAAMDLADGKAADAVAELKRSLAELPDNAQAERMEATALLGLAMQRSGQRSGPALCRRAAEWADASGDPHMVATLHLLAGRTALLEKNREAATIHLTAARTAAAKLGRSETEWRACFLAAKSGASHDCDLVAERLQQSWGPLNFRRALAVAPPGDVTRF